MCSCCRSHYNKDIFGFALMGTSQEPSVGEKYNFPCALIVLCRVFGSVNPIKGAAFGELSGSYQHCTLAPIFPPQCSFGNWNVLGSFILPVRGHTGCPPVSVPPRGVMSLSVAGIDNTVVLGGSLVTLALLSSLPPALMWAGSWRGCTAQHRQRHIQTLLTPTITKMPFFFI